MIQITPTTLEKLRQIDTPTLCNLIELFDIRPRNTGYMDGRIQACYPEMPAVVGFAATATFRSAAAAPQGSSYVRLEEQVQRFGELSGPVLVVFQDLDSPAAAATFGEIMCTTYQAFGAVGLITSGAGRDLDQVHKIGFPVFTNGTICAHGYCHTPDLHVPVHVGGLAVYPDDLLHADRNGVTNLPREIAAEAADAGPEFLATEAVILEALERFPGSLEHLRAARRESSALSAALHGRLSRLPR